MTTIIFNKKYRFDFSSELKENMDCFSNLHKFNDRITFNEEWNKWFNDENIQKLFRIETDKMINSGFDKDVKKKLFESMRYYHRKKNLKPGKYEIEIKNETKKHKNKRYLSEFLENMDNHIREVIKNKVIQNETIIQNENIIQNETIIQNENTKIQINNISPANAFEQYYFEYYDLISDNIDIKNEEQIKKIKKTYKTRMYNIIIRLKKND